MQTAPPTFNATKIWPLWATAPSASGTTRFWRTSTEFSECCWRSCRNSPSPRPSPRKRGEGDPAHSPSPRLRGEGRGEGQSLFPKHAVEGFDGVVGGGRVFGVG